MEMLASRELANDATSWQDPQDRLAKIKARAQDSVLSMLSCCIKVTFLGSKESQKCW